MKDYYLKAPDLSSLMAVFALAGLLNCEGEVIEISQTHGIIMIGSIDGQDYHVNFRCLRDSELPIPLLPFVIAPPVTPKYLWA